MWVFGSVVVCVAIVSIPEATNGDEERNIRQPHTTEIKDPASLLLKYATLEERVQALEFQMENVHDEVTNLEEDIESQITIIQADISVINSGLSEELSKFNTSVTMVTENVQGLTGVTDDLLVSVSSLQETDFDLRQDIVQLTQADRTLDSRLLQLEVDGTVAFHTAFGTYSTMPINSIVVFDTVNVNLGGGYSGSTGRFTTPSGGAGLYYFYVHVSLNKTTFAWINIRHNGTTVAIMREDETGSRDYPSGSCGAVIMMQEGNNVR